MVANDIRGTGINDDAKQYGHGIILTRKNYPHLLHIVWRD